MADLEEQVLHTSMVKPETYVRFIDDIHMIWIHGEDELKRFADTFTEKNPSIRLTLTHSSSHTNFLDTTVSIRNGKIESHVYHKPTDRFSLLHPESFHPPHTTKSIVYSQALRYNRICSDPETRDRQVKELREAFHARKYNRRMVENQSSKALAIPREQLLQYKDKQPMDRTPLVVTYDPSLVKLRKIARELQPLLDNDPYLSQIFPAPPVIAFRQPPNLRRTLVQSKAFSVNNGTFPCQKPRCLLCAAVSNDPIMLPSQRLFNPQGHYNCSSANLVYMIRCKKCATFYIGETCQPLRKRISDHRSTILSQRTQLPVAEHFNSPGHGPSDMKVTVLKGNLHDITKRRMFEQRLITSFDGFKLGLNKDLGFMSHYTH